MRIELQSGLGDVEPEQWDLLTGADDPFVEHAMLRAFETSGTVGGESGWDPCHVTIWDGGELVAALPLYIKAHSYGEFIFDWGWADAAFRLGIDYYPKLVSMVPVTPVTGRRLLLHPDRNPESMVARLIDGCYAAAEQHSASSVHVLFLREEEQRWVQSDKRLSPRLSSQFHWTNEGYRTFDDYLAEFRSAQRKQVKRERRSVSESGLEVIVKTGAELDDADWSALRRFYRDTCARKGSPTYLTDAWFDHVRTAVERRVVAVMAYDKSEAVAGTLNFEKGDTLYGRYWGANEDFGFLHFELCYYRLIERAIERGMKRFEAGAQGVHKLRRGLLPRRIHSAHWIRNDVLRRAVNEFLPREAQAVERELMQYAHHGPFKRGERGSQPR